MKRAGKGMFTEEQSAIYQAGSRAIAKIDWQKVAEKYQKLEWKWFRGNEKEIPNAVDLEATANNVLYWMVDSGANFCSTGGIVITKVQNSRHGGFNVYVFVAADYYEDQVK